MDIRIECIKAVREQTPYTFLCEHGWEMSKEELIDVCKEFCYELMNVSKYSLENVADCLADCWELYE